MKAFNLIDEPWIPVRNGATVREVGLREALLEAHRFQRLEAASPLVGVALTRLLLAVLHRAYRGPQSSREQAQIFARGRFDASAINSYLDRWRDRFWLFHPTAPFWQVPDLPEDDPLPWTKLRPEFAAGNNPTLFDHTYDDAPPLASFAEAARSLAAHQTFTTGGLIRRYGVQSGVGAPLAVSAAFFAIGANLFHTLTQALAAYDESDDQPLWETDPVALSELEGDENKQPRKKVPLLGRTRAYTWLSRGVRLLNTGDGVRYMAYGPGVHPLTDRFDPDPMVAYVKQAKTGNLVPVRLRADKAFWRDFSALFPEDGAGLSPLTLESARHLQQQTGTRRTLRIEVAGQVTDQAKVMEIRRETYPLPTRAEGHALRVFVPRATQLADDTATCLRKGGWQLARLLLSLSRDPDKQEVRALLDSFPLLPYYWNRLGNAFSAFLEKLGDDPDGAWTIWETGVRDVSNAAWAVTTKTVGTEARQLKAVQEAEKTWRTCTAKEARRERKG